MKAVAGNTVFQDLPAENYSGPINGPEDDNYFLGFNTLLEMNWNGSNIQRPLVLQIILTRGGYLYEASYDNFVINPDFSLLSVGQKYGAAWSYLDEHVGYPFRKPANKSAWWAPTDPVLLESAYASWTWLTDPGLRWRFWNNETTTSVMIRFRPLSYDRVVNCPFGVDLSGKSTYYTLERIPGKQLTFQCWNPIHTMKGPGGVLYTSATVECLPGPAGGSYPTWNETLNLPCELNCPASFVKSSYQESCYNFTNSAPLKFGFVSGALT
ncbi:uncharacterized protein [Macrobrachium rosenbergii]|uniref:uncharacterized protein n=1 Tax=Macrobrachium rosenbergii TaxID=79674 RepID=UPI0034D683A0